MKKVIFFFLSALMLAACSSENDGPTPAPATTPGTEVVVMGKQLGVKSHKPADKVNNYADANFFIRIDNRIPGMGKCNSKDYWPRTKSGGSVFANGNKGKVDLSYPYWKFFGNAGITSYVYDRTGNAVQPVLVEVPTVKSILSANKDKSFDFNKLNTEDLHVIWYLAKLEDGLWHVDGVLTFKTVDDITDVPGIDPDEKFEDAADDEKLPEDSNGNIEVDIHQQEHALWQEVKTAVHVRDLVDKVVVEIPLEYNNIAEVDDFNIRTFDLELESRLFINGKEYALDSDNPVKVTIEHQADKAVFTIVCKDAKYLDALRKEFGDGVTVEIHTYPKNLSTEDVWARVKNSTVKVYPENYEHLIFRGATSALY